MPRRRRDVTIPDELVDELLKDYHEPGDLLGESGIIQQMTQRLVERALAGELTHHLKREAEAEDGDDMTSPGPRNSRNGYSKKTVQTDKGTLELAIPRDRNGEFEPILLPKHQRRLAGLDEKIIAMYARGLSLRDISAQLQELYGVEVSASLISEVTDTVLEEVKAWQSRPWMLLRLSGTTPIQRLARFGSVIGSKLFQFLISQWRSAK